MERHVECQAARGAANRAMFPCHVDNLFLDCKLAESEAPEAALKKPRGCLNGWSNGGKWSQRETLSVLAASG